MANQGIDAFPASLARHVGGFLDYLKTDRYSPTVQCVYARRIKELARHMLAAGVAAEQLDEARAERALKELGWTTPKMKQRVYAVHTFVRYLIEAGVTRSCRALPSDSAHSRLRDEYITYLRHQRGLRESSVERYWLVAERFLRFRFGDADGDLAQIVAIDVVRFLQHLTFLRPPARDKTLASNLRNFLMFLFQSGKIKANLAPGIPSVAQKYAARLPRHLTPEQVKTLLAAVKSDTAGGRRNYAMMLLQARLGLRATEVIAIQLDDIDWRAGELIVRGKGLLHDRMPLPEDVGQALADYIRHGRSTICRSLFVTERAPRRPFKNAHVLNLILEGAFKKTGLAPPNRYIGSHILRHSLAVQMVRCGASLDEIRDVLRHRSRRSTTLYARLDVEGLRSVAQPWPAGGAQ